MKVCVTQDKNTTKSLIILKIQSRTKEKNEKSRILAIKDSFLL